MRGSSKFDCVQMIDYLNYRILFRICKPNHLFGIYYPDNDENVKLKITADGVVFPPEKPFYKCQVFKFIPPSKLINNSITDHNSKYY